MASRSDKWRVLVMGAEYDRAEAPIYESSFRGRRVALFKTLLASSCKMDCLYCPFRRGRRGVERRKWRPDKLVDVFLELYRKGVVRGLFLSSGFYGDPDAIVEEEIEVAEKLREKGYTGYIHLRLMPGTSWWYLKQAVRVANRVGINVEAVDASAFQEYAPSKGDWRRDILYRLEYIVREARWGRASVDTQLVAGLAGETDLEILRLVWRLYRALGIGRIHFSAFTPMKGTPLEGREPVPAWREMRLYQVAELVRSYGFSLKELRTILDDNDMLPNMDPKEAYARANPDLYPVDVNHAPLEDLLRVPGIGPSTAELIVRIRRQRRITAATLMKILGPSRARKILRYVDTGEARLF